MSTQPFRPSVETLGERATPIILLKVVPMLTLFSATGISFVYVADPPHESSVDVENRGCSVTLRLAPDCPDCPR